MGEPNYGGKKKKKKKRKGDNVNGKTSELLPLLQPAATQRLWKTYIDWNGGKTITGIRTIIMEAALLPTELYCTAK
jgi:hypothetical protein